VSRGQSRPWSRRARLGAISIFNERGSLTAFVAVFCLTLFILVGLVVDAGRAVAARSAAMSEAEQAARAGAGQVSVESLRSGEVAIDPASAIRVANDYLLSVGQLGGTTTVVGQMVTVHIATEDPTTILGIVGIDSIGISVTASAINVHGVTRED
jgi:Flp pilus assembly protein TadG